MTTARCCRRSAWRSPSAPRSGSLNGLLVTKLRINAFIATVGVGLLLKGYLDNGYDGPAGKTAPALVQGLGYQRIGPVPLSFLLLLAVAAAAWFVLARTRFGHHLIAVGGDPEVARLSGVRNDRVLVTAHVLCALCAGLAGIYLASRLGAGAPRVGTEGLYDLESIAAVVLGGTALAGGRGGVVGTVGGVLLLASIDAIFNQLEVDAFFKQVIRGVIIIAAVAVYARRAMRKAAHSHADRPAPPLRLRLPRFRPGGLATDPRDPRGAAGSARPSANRTSSRRRR